MNKEDVQGLFFWQSSLIESSNPVWESVLKDGHVIGSHAHSHPELPKLSIEEQRIELSQSKTILESVIGEKVNLFRPPFGLYNEDTVTLANELGLQIVLWQVASWDWMHEKDPDMILHNVETYTNPGDLILLHELQQTVHILPELIRRLKAKGYEFAKPHGTLF